MQLEKTFKDKLTLLSSHFRHEDFYYKNLYDFTLREGKMYEKKNLTPEERMFVMKRIKSLNGSFAQNQCFHNSGKLAMGDLKDKIKYVEGFVFKAETGIPILHAWNEINGKVIDITLINKFGEFTLGLFENDIAYRGTIFPIDYIRRMFISKNSRSILSDISDPENLWPVLKNKFNTYKLNIDNVTDFINSYPTKYKEGFTDDEIKSILKNNNINNFKLGVNTCVIKDGIVVTYSRDFERALTLTLK